MDINEIIDSIPQKIIEARVKRRLTQRDLAELLEVSQSSISAWERRDKQIAADALIRLLYKLDLFSIILPGIEQNPQQDDLQRLAKFVEVQAQEIEYLKNEMDLLKHKREETKKRIEDFAEKFRLALEALSKKIFSQASETKEPQQSVVVPGGGRAR